MKAQRNFFAGARACGLLAAGGLFAASSSFADVTVVEDTTINATIVKVHMTATERTAGEKQRRDSSGKMDGPLSFLAGSMASGDIVRLDRDLEWHLEPDKKKYMETLFPTAAQRALAQQKMQAMLDKMKSCPVGPAQKPQPTDTGCEKTDPKFSVVKTDESATIAGHTARKTQLSMTYSCKDVKTGDTCDFVVSSDMWLSQETIAGYDEQRAFGMEYAKKLGLDDMANAMAGQVRMAMAPYMDQMKQLSARAGDLKGTPLRTLFSVSVGGPQCSKAKSSDGTGPGLASSTGTVGDAGTAAGDAAAQSASSSTTTAATSRADQMAGSGVAGQVLGSAAGAFTSKLLGGLMSKKSDPKPATPVAGTTPITSGSMLTLMSFQTEVSSISTAAIEPGQFDVPAGWQKIEPKVGKGGNDEFQCPKTGS